MQHLKPVNAAPPVGFIKVDDSSKGEIEIVSHVHSPVAPDCLDDSHGFERHPLHETIKNETGQGTLEWVPVQFHFERPEHNIRARYEGWADGVEGMPVCTGNGQKAVLLNAASGERQARVCKGPKLCKLVQLHGVKCSFQARADVLVNGQALEVRTNSENAYSAILAALRYAKARYGNLTRQIFNLQAWQKSTRGSKFEAFTTLTLLRTNAVDDAGNDGETAERMDELGDEIAENWAQAFEVSLADALPDSCEPPFEISRVKEQSKTSDVKRSEAVLFPFGTDGDNHIARLIYKQAASRAEATS
ncbi:hypothetical protein [Diaphorobacter sp. LR2014-1]|uniref:recombination directionality factor n=1 Tax=Diaphorobacter sp. LR2014-1 TaxID=1933219 RepID=UPI0011AEEA67|nr:hypothetical protein [Diaphorobacter sp. LR2014-1]